MLWAHNKLRLLVTGACNARCPHCHNEGMRFKNGLIPVDLVELVISVAEASGEAIKTATITGGEALLHPRISELVEMVRRVSPKITVSTNALNLSESLSQQLVGAGVTRFRIDIDPYRLTGPEWNPNGLDVLRLDSSCRIAKQYGANLELNSVLTNYTSPGLVSVLRFCKERFLNIKFFERVLPGPDTLLRPAPDVSRKILEDAIFEISKSVEVVPQPGTGDFTYAGMGFTVRFCGFLCPYGKCGFSGTRVDPSGFVSACMNSRLDVRIFSADTAGSTSERIARAVKVGCSCVPSM